MSRTMMILAAGASSRMGRPKALLVWKGKTLLEHAVLRVRDAGFSPLVVLGAQGDCLQGKVPEGTPWVINSEWQQGIGSSIAFGVRCAIREHDPEWIGISLVDQPLVTSEHLRDLGDQLTQEFDCVATSYPGGPGVPAVFGSGVLERLAQLSGDKGAKALMTCSGLRVKQIEFSGTLDIDDAEAWADFLERYD